MDVLYGAVYAFTRMFTSVADVRHIKTAHQTIIFKAFCICVTCGSFNHYSAGIDLRR